MKTNVLCSAILAVAVVAWSGTAFAQRADGGGRGRPSFDTLLGAFDENDDESLSEDEVPGPVWARLSRADADEDGTVTREEFDAVKKPR